MTGRCRRPWNMCCPRTASIVAVTARWDDEPCTSSTLNASSRSSSRLDRTRGGVTQARAQRTTTAASWLEFSGPKKSSCRPRPARHPGKKQRVAVGCEERVAVGVDEQRAVGGDERVAVGCDERKLVGGDNKSKKYKQKKGQEDGVREVGGKEKKNLPGGCVGGDERAAVGGCCCCCMLASSSRACIRTA